MQDLKDRLAETMREKGLNQSQVADLIGVDQGTISKVLRGSTIRGAERLQKFANFLKTDEAEMLVLAHRQGAQRETKLRNLRPAKQAKNRDFIVLEVRGDSYRRLGSSSSWAHLGRNDIDPLDRDGAWVFLDPNGRPVPFDSLPSSIALKEGREVRFRRMGIQLGTADPRWVSGSVTPLYGAEGEITVLVCEIQEI